MSRKLTGIRKQCLACKKEMYVPACWVKRKKFCSIACYNAGKVGRPSRRKGIKTGVPAWNNKRVSISCQRCGRIKQISPSVARRTKYCSQSCSKTGKPSWNKGIKTGHTPWNKGKHWPEMTGTNHPLWKGGLTSESEKIRKSLEYKLWRTAVFSRDNFTCVWCGVRGVELNADHIKAFSQYPALRFAIDNGRTLCVPCHKKTDNYGEKAKPKKVSTFK